MEDHTITYPAAPQSGGVGQALKWQKVLDNISDQSSGLIDEVPLIRVDYREFTVNTVHNRAFSHIFLPVGVGWIDDLLKRKGFIRSFKDNMRRMLDTGEYFVMLGVNNGDIDIDRLPRDWVRHCAFYEKTGELLYLVYIEPVVLLQKIHQISWRRTTWTPTSVKMEISLDDNPNEEKAYTVIRHQLNPYGFIPVIPFKLGTEERGQPIWRPVEHIISQIQDIVNDIRLINAYNAAPIKYIKTDGEFTGVNDEGLIQIGIEDELGALTIQIGRSLFDELSYAVGIMSDIVGIPITSILQVGKHASGEAIEKRLDTLTRESKSLREHVGQQMQLMFKMFAAFISMGLVEVDLEDPGIAIYLTDQVVSMRDSYERRETAKAIYASNLGTPVDLTAYGVPDVKWVPIEKINPQDFLQLMQGLQTAVESEFISNGEARRLLAMNVEHLLVAEDLETIDSDESGIAHLGDQLGILERAPVSMPLVGITTLQ